MIFNRLMSCLVLAMAPLGALHAQGAVAAWAFARIGPAKTSLKSAHDEPGEILGGFSAGIAASRGRLIGMIRATDTERVGFSDTPSAAMGDYAILGGVRTRGDRLFLAGAAGIAQAMPYRNATSGRQLAPTFDVSAHANYIVPGMVLSVSGVAGRTNTRYIAASLGFELGWFGLHRGD